MVFDWVREGGGGGLLSWKGGLGVSEEERKPRMALHGSFLQIVKVMMCLTALGSCLC